MGLGSKKLFCICHLNRKIFLTKTFSQPTVLIWDSDGEPPAGDRLTVLWRNYDTKGRNDVVSIPCLVEDNAESLRARYLAWIYDLGETKVKGKRIVDHLEIRPGFSYWWMTLLAQKCTYAASPNIYHAIRLLACEHVCKATEIEKITVVTSQPLLAAELQEWCDANNRSFEQTINGSDEILKKKFGWLLKCLPSFIVGIVACIGYYVQRMRFGNRNAYRRKAIPGALMFFDIFTHLNLNDAKIRNSFSEILSNYFISLNLPSSREFDPLEYMELRMLKYFDTEQKNCIFDKIMIISNEEKDGLNIWEFRKGLYVCSPNRHVL